MALITCPECSERVSSEAKQCPQCGFPVGKMSHIGPAAGVFENYTKVKITPVKVREKLGGGIVCLLLSPVLFFIPCIGWLAGIVLLFLGLWMLFTRAADLGVIEGDCPYCSLPLSGASGQKSLTCGHCKQNVIFKNGYFLTLAAAMNPGLDLPEHEMEQVTPQLSRNMKFSIFFGVLVMIGFVVVVQIDWEQVGVSALVEEKTKEEVTPSPQLAEVPSLPPELPFPRPVVATRDIVIPLEHGTMTVVEGREFTLEDKTATGYSARFGRTEFQVSAGDFIEK